jgi:phosphoglucosamine mutase
MVKEQGAHIGISLDGDADRAIFSDEKGNVVDGDRGVVGAGEPKDIVPLKKGGRITTR